MPVRHHRRLTVVHLSETRRGGRSAVVMTTNRLTLGQVVVGLGRQGLAQALRQVAGHYDVMPPLVAPSPSSSLPSRLLCVVRFDCVKPSAAHPWLPGSRGRRFLWKLHVVSSAGKVVAAADGVSFLGRAATFVVADILVHIRNDHSVASVRHLYVGIAVVADHGLWLVPPISNIRHGLHH